MYKRGQVTIFIIVALVLVSVIVVFALSNRTVTPVGQDNFNPNSFMRNCIEKNARNNIDVMMRQGGYLSPTDYKMYKEKINYICKTNNFYEPCIMQKPVFFSDVQSELENNLKSQVEGCFSDFEQELEERNYDFDGSNAVVSSDIKPGRIFLSADRDMSITKDGETRQFDSFDTNLNSEFYDMIRISQKIASQEAQFCYFENLAYNLVYPDFSIEKTTLSDGTKIYTITSKETNEEMNIATRGCVIPAGL